VPKFNGISIANVICDGAKQAVVVTGLPDTPVENIELKNVIIKANTGFAAEYAKNFTLTNVKIYPSQGKAITIKNSQNILVDGVLYSE
jgi:hypothetical protein